MVKNRITRGEASICDLVSPDFSETCGCMQYFFGGWVLYISLKIPQQSVTVTQCP